MNFSHLGIVRLEGILTKICKEGSTVNSEINEDNTDEDELDKCFDKD